MPDFHSCAVWFAVAYTTLGAIDAVWLHLWCYRLHRVAPSEHALHTVRTFLLLPVILFIVGQGSGIWLWCAVLAALVDLALVAWDAAVEHESRRFQQGLPPFEAGLHTILQALHVLMLAAGIAAKSSAAWSLTGDQTGSGSDPLDLIILVVFSGSVLFALLHAWLLVQTRRQQIVTAAHARR